MKSLTVASLLVASSQAQPWDYADNGAEWLNVPGFDVCKNDGGSPISFNADDSAYDKIDVAKDRLSATFSNQRNIQVTTLDAEKNFLPGFSIEGNANSMQSNVGEDTLGS